MGKVGPRQVDNGEDGSRKVGLGQDGIRQVGFEQIRPGQVGTGKVFTKRFIFQFIVQVYLCLTSGCFGDTTTLHQNEALLVPWIIYSSQILCSKLGFGAQKWKSHPD